MLDRRTVELVLISLAAAFCGGLAWALDHELFAVAFAAAAVTITLIDDEWVLHPSFAHNRLIRAKAHSKYVRRALDRVPPRTHLASARQEGGKNANIDAGLEFIWRISDE
jgi:hypothetical protein